MIGIYKITNKINGKCYIGQSDNIHRRWREHKKLSAMVSGPQYNNPLYKSMRKHGMDNFKFEVIEECAKDNLDEREIYYIAFFDSNNRKFGYNLTTGGSRAATKTKLSTADIQAIKTRLKTTLDNMFVVAEDFNVHWTTIRTINAGLSHFDAEETYPLRKSIYILKANNRTAVEYHCPLCGTKVSKKGFLCRQCFAQTNRIVAERPSPLDLAQQICETSFEAVGTKYGVSGKAIAKWCQSYEIPHTKEALKQWYCEQTHTTYIPPQPKTKKQSVPQEKPVQQIDLQTGDVINTFSSIADAYRHLNTAGHISDVCLGKRKSAHGYGWKYAEET